MGFLSSDEFTYTQMNPFAFSGMPGLFLCKIHTQFASLKKMWTSCWCGITIRVFSFIIQITLQCPNYTIMSYKVEKSLFWGGGRNLGTSRHLLWQWLGSVGWPHWCPLCLGKQERWTDRQLQATSNSFVSHSWLMRGKWGDHWGGGGSNKNVATAKRQNKLQFH